MGHKLNAPPSSAPAVPKLVYIVAAAMLLLAVAPLPYGYYQLLRLVVAVAGVWIAWDYWQRGRQAWAIAFGLVTLLFNPVLPVHLDRATWQALNVIAAAVFAAGAYDQHRRQVRS